MLKRSIQNEKFEMCEVHPLCKVPDGGHAVDGDQVQGLLRPGGPEVAD